MRQKFLEITELLKISGLLDHHQLGYESNDALALRSRKLLLDTTVRTMCAPNCKVAALDVISGKESEASRSIVDRIDERQPANGPNYWKNVSKNTSTAIKINKR